MLQTNQDVRLVIADCVSVKLNNDLCHVSAELFRLSCSLLRRFSGTTMEQTKTTQNRSVCGVHARRLLDIFLKPILFCEQQNLRQVHLLVPAAQFENRRGS